MATFYLHGGGDDARSRIGTFGRFIQAAFAQGSGPIVLVAAGASFEAGRLEASQYRSIFEAAGATSARLVTLGFSPDTPPKPNIAELDPAALFICGGVTPLYQQTFCEDRSWLTPLLNRNVLIGGASAGAAIMGQPAILGGWRIQRNEQVRQILFQGASEGLDLLTVSNGLGLVPFSIDVHASQAGTLTRLIHAVTSGSIEHGWAIDEGTMLMVEDEIVVGVYGAGQAYRVISDPVGRALVTLYPGRE